MENNYRLKFELAGMSKDDVIKPMSGLSYGFRNANGSVHYEWSNDFIKGNPDWFEEVKPDPPEVYTFNIANRKLKNSEGQFLSCYFLGSESNGKKFIKDIDFSIKYRSELPNPVFEAVEIEKNKTIRPKKTITVSGLIGITPHYTHYQFSPSAPIDLVKYKLKIEQAITEVINGWDEHTVKVAKDHWKELHKILDKYEKQIDTLVQEKIYQCMENVWNEARAAHPIAGMKYDTFQDFKNMWVEPDKNNNMEVKIEMSYRGKTKTASLICSGFDNVTMIKVVNALCNAMHSIIVEEAGGADAESAAGVNWNVSWNKK